MMNQQCTLYSGSRQSSSVLTWRESGVWRCTVREEEEEGGRKRKGGSARWLLFNTDRTEKKKRMTEPECAKRRKLPSFPPPPPPGWSSSRPRTTHYPVKGTAAFFARKGKGKGRTGKMTRKTQRERKREREKRAKGGVRRVMEERQSFSGENVDEEPAGGTFRGNQPWSGRK